MNDNAGQLCGGPTNSGIWGEGIQQFVFNFYHSAPTLSIQIEW